MEPTNIRETLQRAEERVRNYLARHGVELPQVSIVFDHELEKGALATHRYPATVVIRGTSLPESVIAHELVHIAQGTLEQFRGFRLLYVLLSEGLAEWVTKLLYPEHEIRYQVGYRLMELLVAADEGRVRDLLRLNDLPLVPGDVAAILTNPRLVEYSRDLLSPMAERIRQTIRIADKEGIADPTFVTLGEEIRAWKFLLESRFEAVAERVDGVLPEWFGTAV